MPKITQLTVESGFHPGLSVAPEAALPDSSCPQTSVGLSYERGLGCFLSASGARTRKAGRQILAEGVRKNLLPAGAAQ